jgi:hypothetical protein
MGAVKKRSDDGITLHASGAETASGTGDETFMMRPPNACIGVLDVTVGQTDATDKIDVVIQTRIGGTWWTVIAFDQILGDDPDKTWIEKIVSTTAQAGYEVGSPPNAGAIKNMIGEAWRAKWTVTNGNDAAFTFSVTLMPI